jgi:hypothetical protein
MVQSVTMEHEVGHAPPRGMPEIPRDKAEGELSEIAGKPISLGDKLAMTGAPETCPACGSTEVRTMDMLAREEVHPVVWGDGYGTADSYICASCDAGWIEGWKPHPITWVRPWRAG